MRRVLPHNGQAPQVSNAYLRGLTVMLPGLFRLRLVEISGIEPLTS